MTVKREARLLLTVNAIRALEARFLPHIPLMQRAGAALANHLRRWAEQGHRIVLLCGPGNNGGDGLVAATRLHELGFSVTVVAQEPSERRSPEARAAWHEWRACGGETCNTPPQVAADRPPVIVDALFGIGLTRPIANPYREWIHWANCQAALRVAVDVPSGLDADTGACLGDAVFEAHETVTFLADKPGLHTHDGPDVAGAVTVFHLGLDDEIAAQCSQQQHALFAYDESWGETGSSAPASAGILLDRTLFSPWLTPRKRNVHKGCFGHAVIIGGAAGMRGALHLAARSALYLGSGKVSAITLAKDAARFDPTLPEVMWPTALPQDATAVAIGPGLGQTSDAVRWLEQAVALATPLVIDADGLNLLAQHTALQHAVDGRGAPTVLTPHPGEAARLLQKPPHEIQKNRIAAAVAIAHRYQSVVILKGCGSVIATPHGHWAINPTGHGGMASGGMGDTLTGILAALLAQGWPSVAAAACAAYLHGSAAEAEAQAEIGPVGLTASETAAATRRLFNRWIADGAPRAQPVRPLCDTPSFP
ncbi:NAD(P)H-hydrate dehydratase [Hydrogenophilus thiooxidans]|uniref:NAD(P)H-hydrate dehydratase n=1 Tax=Hydrogenophilus thiooxidans TaxID=2820326 RepID=UPI001C231527